MTFGRALPVLSLLLLLPTLIVAEDTPIQPAEAAPPVSFHKDILPIFQAQCQGCHQPAKANGGYDMTDFARLLQGGESTLVAVSPKNLTDSNLLSLITPVDGKAEMPQGKKPLSEVEIGLIRRWIEEGALDDTPLEARRKYDAEHPPTYSLPPVITALDFSPGGELLAISGFHEVLLYKANGSELVGRLIGLSARIESIRFSPDGTKLAVTGGLPGRTGEVQVWETATRKLLVSVTVTYDTVYGASWSPDGKLIAFGCADNSVRAIEAETGKQVLYQGSHSDWVFDTVFSTDGSHLASVGRDMTAKLTNVETERFIDNITSITPGALKGGISAVTRHPQRDEILFGGSDGTPKIYMIYRKEARKIGDDSNLIRQFPTTPGRIFSVDFAPDGLHIVAGSSLDGKGAVYIYRSGYDPNVPPEITAIQGKPADQQTPEEKQKLAAYLQEQMKLVAQVNIDTASIYAVAFSADGKTIAASGSDGQVRLIDAASGNILKQFLPVKIETGETAMMMQGKQFATPKAAQVDPDPLPTGVTFTTLKTSPEQITLTNPVDGVQLLVLGQTQNGDWMDVTRMVEFKPSDSIIQVERSGQIQPLKDGTASLTISLGGMGAQVPVSVSGMSQPYHISYMRDVMPVMSKLGCNQGTCHGAKDGKNGFKLSLRGYDPIYDIRALTDDLEARRANVASPENSLMLLKATGQVPHVGGQVTKQDEKYYAILRQWISEGAKLDLNVPKVDRIQIVPENPVVQQLGTRQQMRIIATYTSGEQRDVTAEAFVTSSNGDIATVSSQGLVTVLRRGEAAMLARFEGKYAATTMTVMGDREGFAWQEPPANNDVDKLVAAKLQRMKILSSGLCTDAEFVRRVYLDLTGLPPTVETVEKFLADSRDTTVKRNELIDQLIGNPDFIDHWTNKWADLLQVNRKFLGPEGAAQFRAWIRNEVAQNTPYDQFARKVLTATGSNKENPPASYYKILREPVDMMENTTHLFLAVRFNCNKCHDHPFERWTQDQYYQTAAYFAQTGLKGDPAAGNAQIGGTAVEGGKPLYEIVYDMGQGEVKHDRTGAITAPEFPYPATMGDTSGKSRREQLAAWITSPDNQYFAKSYVNRIWGYLTGVGLIEPLDDIRAGNPPTNPELLDWLTAEFIKSGFDTRQLIRTICQSRTYQLSIETNRWNADDTVNYSHAIARRLPAEALFDAIHSATGSVPNIPGVPAGTRAAQLPDAGLELPSGFLANLGRPVRESSCECERSSDLQLGPVMALVGGPIVGDAISDPNNAIAKLVAGQKDDREMVNRLFLRILNRPATEHEIKASLDLLASLKADHQETVAELEKHQAYLAPITAEKEKARQAGIEAAKQELEAYQQQIAAREKELDEKQQQAIAQATQAVQQYEQAQLPGKFAEWEQQLSVSSGWVPVKFQTMTSTNRAKLQQREDLSVFVTGAQGKTVYELIATTDLTNITGIKLEALTDDQLGGKGPGRAQNGNFVVSEFAVFQAPKDQPKNFKQTALQNAKADFSQGGYDVATAIDGLAPEAGNGWAIVPETGKDHVATFEFKENGLPEAGSVLKFSINQQYSDGQHALGRFRISVTNSPRPLDVGLPKEIQELVALPADQRTAEQKQKLLDHYKGSDAEYKKLQDALAAARQPRPVDPELKKRQDGLATASKPLPVDPRLERLTKAVELSRQQLGNERLTAAQDIAWALINSPAFLFNR